MLAKTASAAFDAAYAEGLRDPLAVLNAAHCPRAP